MRNDYEVAKAFWTNSKNYPAYPNTLKRRLIDTNFVAERLFGIKSVLDLGCGDGSMLLSLREFTAIEEFYGCDLSSNLLSILENKWGNYSGLTTICGSLVSGPFPKTEATLSLGAFPYIFDDKDLCTILHNINSEVLIVRSPCTLLPKDEYINKYSEDLKAHYAAVYRTVDNCKKLLSDKFNVIETVRAYPDEIESKYGTKHFFFVCKIK
jgi:SAM-dependent methyltransferase